MKETTEGLKCAAEVIGDFAKEVVVEMQSMAPVEVKVPSISKT
uniref:Uncharacterized protein n=1 Tax=Peronospora matthiolae TaxID=2874970 RepID=A0AAV1UD18_9STRA